MRFLFKFSPMKGIINRFLIINIFLFSLSCSSPSSGDVTVSLKTTLGEIRLKLYDLTPIHRDNFIKLVKSGFYDGVSFHRVINNFMIQAGDPETKAPVVSFPDSIKTYTLPAEFRHEYFHKKGALAAAREGDDVNPEMRSSGTQFYIVQGKKYTEAELSQLEDKINNNLKRSYFNKFVRETTDSIAASGNVASGSEIQEIASMKMFRFIKSHNDFKIPDDQKNVYMTLGGTPFLDGTYTVFGEVISGLDVVDKIAAVKTENDRPVTDVKIIKARIIK